MSAALWPITGVRDSAGHGGFLSGLDWVLVCPAMLSDKPARGTIRALTDLSEFHGGGIARADVARFELDQVGSDEWLRQATLIAR